MTKKVLPQRLDFYSKDETRDRASNAYDRSINVNNNSSLYADDEAVNMQPHQSRSQARPRQQHTLSDSRFDQKAEDDAVVDASESLNQTLKRF